MPFTSDAANNLLWTPFDNKCINKHNLENKVSNDEFLTKCFSQPFFKNTDLTEDRLGLFDDDPITKEETNKILNEEADKYSVFLSWLDKFENHKVYTLSGNSGTGKTTLLYQLKKEITRYEWTIVDLNKPIDKIDWLGDISTSICKSNSATRKTFAAILNEIHQRVFDEKSNDKKVVKIYNNLNFLIRNYERRFQNSYLSGFTLFNNLCKIFNSNTYDSNKKVETSAQLFEQFFLNDKDTDDYALLGKAMDILLLILRCTDNSIEQKHIIVFDNFERFIAEDEIYNDEINKIRVKLASYDVRINKKSNHDLKFKFIMSMRCSTARICGIKLHPSDEEPSNIDISSWFSIGDILTKRIDWFNQLNINNDNYRLLSQIASDSRKHKDGDLTGLKMFLDPLFNDNKRLLVEFLGIIIENKKNNEKFDYEFFINKYKETWNLGTSISRCAARNIIKGIVLFKLKNIDSFFKNIEAYKEDDTKKDIKPGIGLPRRILTILYNKVTTTNNEMLFSELIAELYATTSVNISKWRSDGYKDRRKLLSKILYHMSFCNRRENDWIQLIDLQLDEANNKLKIKNPAEMEQCLYDNFEDFKISIMPAGIAYLKYIVPTFEYFSIRYLKNYCPLFATVPDDKDTIKNVDVKSFQCYKIIKKIQEQAALCIANINDNNIKYKTKKGNNLLHAERIIDSHCFFLNNFMAYIQEVYIEKSTTTDIQAENYRKLITEIQLIKNDYKSIERKKQ